MLRKEEYAQFLQVGRTGDLSSLDRLIFKEWGWSNAHQATLAVMIYQANKIDELEQRIKELEQKEGTIDE